MRLKPLLLPIRRDHLLDWVSKAQKCHRNIFSARHLFGGLTFDIVAPKLDAQGVLVHQEESV